jgi:hypothetical protein
MSLSISDLPIHRIPALFCIILLSSILSTACSKSLRPAKNRTSVVPNLYPLELDLKIHSQKADHFCLNATALVELDCPEVRNQCPPVVLFQMYTHRLS